MLADGRFGRLHAVQCKSVPALPGPPHLSRPRCREVEGWFNPAARAARVVDPLPRVVPDGVRGVHSGCTASRDYTAPTGTSHHRGPVPAIRSGTTQALPDGAR